MKPENLHRQQYWNNLYSHKTLIPANLKLGIFTSYDIYLCDEILKKFIPKHKYSKKNPSKICEIGSGDGKLLKKLGIMFGCIPYGIEYSKEIAASSKQIGVKTIVKDAFSKDILKKYKNYFDIVYSYGFVEHILPPEKAIKLHIDLVKPGGYFIVQIPRFVGFNRWRLKFFTPDLISGHNIKIMDEKALEKLCEFQNVKKIICKNYGTFKLRLPIEKKDCKYYLLKTIIKAEFILNPLFRLLFGNKGFETKMFSPAVIFIGRKNSR